MQRKLKYLSTYCSFMPKTIEFGVLFGFQLGSAFIMEYAHMKTDCLNWMNFLIEFFSGWNYSNLLRTWINRKQGRILVEIWKIFQQIFHKLFLTHSINSWSNNPLNWLKCFSARVVQQKKFAYKIYSFHNSIFHWNCLHFFLPNIF